jgi:hypothetical protein
MPEHPAGDGAIEAARRPDDFADIADVFLEPVTWSRCASASSAYIAR